MGKKASTPSPKPIPINVVCDLCNEPWHLHQADETGDVTTLECIRLLKLKAVPQYRGPVVIDRPVPYPYPVYPNIPWPHRWYGSGTYCISSGNTNQAQYDGAHTINAASTSPKVLMAASAVAE
jgi:hypothetical protein